MIIIPHGSVCVGGGGGGRGGGGGGGGGEEDSARIKTIPHCHNAVLCEYHLVPSTTYLVPLCFLQSC